MSPKIRALLELARVSNLPTVWSNCIAGWVLGGGEFGIELLPLLLGGSLIYSAGMLFNDVFDFEWDRHHRPERPIPRGAITARNAFGIGVGAMIAGAVLFTVAGVAVAWTLALIAAIVIYDKMHKQWLGAVYVMGACRLLLYLCAASAGGGSLRLLVFIWGLAVGVYTVGITVIARGEAGDGAVPKIGLALLAAPLVAAVYAKLIYSDPSAMFGVCVLVWLGWMAWTIYGVWEGTKEAKIAGVGKLIAGLVLIDAMAVAPAYGWLGMTMAILLPSVLIAQRKVAAT